MAKSFDAFEVEDSMGSPLMTLSEYTEGALEEHAGGAGKFQYLYLLLLGLPWSYQPLLAMVSIFAGKNAVAKEAIGMVNCSAVGEPFVLPPLNTSASTPLPVEDSYIMEFGLLCGRHELVPLLGTLYFIGYLIGVPFFGALSDRFGRRIAYFVPLVVMQVGAILAAMAPSYWTYAAMRVLEGFGVAGFGLVAYVWTTEMLGPELRPAMTWAPHVLWSVGQVLLSVLAFELRPWRSLLWAIAVLGLSFFAYFPMLQESPIWLASKGRSEEVYAVLCKIAKANGRRKPPPPNFKPLAEGAVEKGQGGGLLQLLDQRLLGRFLVMCMNWFTTAMAFYGLSLNATSLPLNEYWANVVDAVVAIPVYFLAVVMIERPACGRRGALCSGLLVCGGCLLLSSVANETGMIVLYYLAVSAVSLVFSVIYIYAAELFPTDIRASSMGLQSLCARLGAMSAPFVADLGNEKLTLMIFGAPCIVAGLATLLLPETRGKPLPSTIDDLDAGGMREDETSSCSESE